MGRGDLSDAEWELIGTLLPSERGRWARPAGDNRRFLNGMLHVLRVGCPWRDMHERYGKWNSVYVRFRRWAEQGVWDALLQTLVDLGLTDDWQHMIDSTTVRGHVSAAGGNVWLAPSASGLCLMIWSVCENVSGLSAWCRWPRWRSARPGPHKGAGIECHFTP
nr:IS5 family transposase [Sphingobium phenoxybenzoativorans]